MTSCSLEEEIGTTVACLLRAFPSNEGGVRIACTLNLGPWDERSGTLAAIPPEVTLSSDWAASLAMIPEIRPLLTNLALTR